VIANKELKNIRKSGDTFIMGFIIRSPRLNIAGVVIVRRTDRQGTWNAWIRKEMGTEYMQENLAEGDDHETRMITLKWTLNIGWCDQNFVSGTAAMPNLCAAVHFLPLYRSCLVSNVINFTCR
jgi:hypothetical protein